MQTALQKLKLNRAFFYIGLCLVLATTMVGWYLGSVTGASSEAARLINIGRLFGLLAAVSILLEVFLMSRTPLVERNFDLHDLVDLHRLNGYAVLASISGHVVFLVLGYSAVNHSSYFSQFLNFNNSYEDVLKASIGTVIFFGATFLSVAIARKKLPYQLWYLTHLTMYLSILLVFGHQLKNGGDFIGQGWFQSFWYGLYFLVFGLLGYYRFIAQLLSYFKHQFYIERIVHEAEDIYSVYVGGKNINDFEFSAGQYANWRILNKQLWHEAHPFSFSSMPYKNHLRFTVKSSGDFSNKLMNLKKGTKLLIDGPRGAFTTDRAEEARNVVLVAGGVGVAPYLATIHGLLNEGKSVTLLYAARELNQLAFASELTNLQQHGLQVKTFLSSRGSRIDKKILSRFIDNQTVVFLCGPDVMSRNLATELKEMGLSKDQIIAERFAY